MNIIARNLNIRKPHKLPSNSLTNLFKRFLITKKLNDLGLNKLSKRYVSLYALDRIQKLNELSDKVLKELGELQQIRNYDILSKEEMIYALLRSRNANEDDYIFSITTDFDKSTLDNEIKATINKIKQLVTRLGNLLTSKERNKIKKELHELLKKLSNARLRKRQKEKILLTLIEHHNSLSKKEKYMDIDYDNLPYQGNSDISQLVYPMVIDKYYEPELVNSSFNSNCERYRINGDKNKEISFNEYLNAVRPNIKELVDKKRSLVNEKFS